METIGQPYSNIQMSLQSQVRRLVKVSKSGSKGLLTVTRPQTVVIGQGLGFRV